MIAFFKKKQKNKGINVFPPRRGRETETTASVVNVATPAVCVSVCASILVRPQYY